MSLKYRDSQGTETPVAGLNGTSGELVPSVALYQSGTASIPMPSTSALTDLFTTTVTFDTPFDDTDYVLNVDECSVSEAEINRVYNKTTTGFTVAIKYNRQLTVVPSYSVTAHLPWQAFKLMTDEVHEADAAAIAQNTANFAPTFSVTTSYAVGDYCTYNGILYRCTTAHTAGVWVAGHFTQVTVGSDFVSIKNTLKKTNQVILDTGDSGGSVTYKKIVIGFSGLTASRTNQTLLLTGRAGESWIIGMVNAGGTSQAINCTQVVKGAEKIQDIKCAFTARTQADGDFIIYVKLGTYNSSLRVTTLTDYNGNVTAELSDITETEYNAVTNIATVNKLVTESNPLMRKYIRATQDTTNKVFTFDLSALGTSDSVSVSVYDCRLEVVGGSNMHAIYSASLGKYGGSWRVETSSLLSYSGVGDVTFAISGDALTCTYTGTAYACFMTYINL